MSKKSPDQQFAEKYKELSELYFDVKEKVILAEEVYKKFPVTLVNELRNSYDHIFRIFTENKFESEEEINKQFISANRHLKRAGYDACELIVSGYVAKTQKILHGYPYSVLTHVMPQRYSEIKIFLNKVHTEKLVKARTRKNLKTKMEDDIEVDELYPDFASIIEEVEAVWEEVTAIAPELEQCRNSKRNKSIQDIVVQVLIGIALLAAGAFLGPKLIDEAQETTADKPKITTPANGNS